MKHNEISQVVIGLCILEKMDPQAISEGKLWGPYAAVLGDLKKGMDRTELIAKHGVDPIRTAILAAETTEGMEGFEWIRHLEEVAVMAEAAFTLGKLVDKLDSGTMIDPAKLMNMAGKLETAEMDFVPMGEIEPLKNPWTPSYYPPWDEHIGGYPQGGLTIIAGPAGLGKTTLLLDLFARAAREGKRTAFFSLEVVKQLAAMRMLEIHPKLTKKTRNFILTSGEIAGVDEIFAKCVRLKAQYPDLYMIGIDYADKMIEREQSESEMGHIYDQCAKLSTVLNTPVVLIAGVSRGYVGGEPMANHIRYSGRAEHDASLIILLVNPDKLAVDMGAKNKGNLPYHAGMGYLKVAKSRFGTKEGGLGAIQVEWIDKGGHWGDDSFGWHPIQFG